MIKKVKNTVSRTYVTNNLKGEKIIGTFYEKELPKTDQQEFRVEKIIKKKVTNYMSNGKVMIVHSISGLIKKTQINKSHFSCIKNEPIFS